MRPLLTDLFDRLRSFIPGYHPPVRVLQFPVTGRCNSQCKTCSVPALAPNVDISIEEVKKVVNDPFFKKLRAIGLNGGEPILVKHLPEITRLLLTLPKLKSIHLITNGILTEQTLNTCKKIYALCQEKRVQFILSVSLDGVDEIYQACRGVPCFEKTIRTIQALTDSPHTYCHAFQAGCTVSRHNVHHLTALEAYCHLHRIPIFYRLAVSNHRIHNEAYLQDFSVLSNETDRQTAMEFFFGKVVDRNDRNWKQKFVYYTIFKYLESKGQLRLADCFWKWRDATVDETGQLYYCATRSQSLGTLDGTNARRLFLAPDHLQHRDEIIQKHCSECIHYAFSPTLKGALSFLGFFLHLLLFPYHFSLERRLK